MSELFPIASVKCDSPRLAWMKANKVKTLCSGAAEDFDGEPWNAWSNDSDEMPAIENCRFGATEDEALANFAKSKGMKLWNEIIASPAYGQ